MPRARTQSELFTGSPAPPVVSHIEPLAKDPNLRRIKVNGKAVATLKAGDAESLAIAVGRAWTDTLAQRIARVQAVDKARRDALGLLSRRGYSAQALSERLGRRGHDAAIVKQVIDEARRDGWLNEQALAEDIVRSATSRRPAGRRLIEERLARHGVEGGVARQVAGAAAANQDDRAAAYQLARKRIATMGSVKPQAALRRIAGLLARRGFDQDIVDDAIERVRGLLPHGGEKDA